MIVRDEKKLYATHEGMARELGVFHDGWVPSFKDVKNGDTGTLLAESAPNGAVALRIHRNGSTVCMSRKGVELAGFNGVWDSGADLAAEINGDFVKLSDGTVSQFRADQSSGHFSVTLGGISYTAELQSDDKIHWSGGDVWRRHLGPRPKDILESAQGPPAILGPTHMQPQTFSDAVDSAQGEPTATSPAGAEVSRLSTVTEVSESSTSSPEKTNQVQNANSEVRPSTESKADEEAEALSSQRLLFSAVAAQMSDAKGCTGAGCAGACEKKTRREKSMCCC
jgi:hypothetical protein